VHVMELDSDTYREHTKPMQSLINVGSGKDVTIRELAELIAKVVGYAGKIEQDLDKPDGTPRKLMDVSRLHQLGWQSKTALELGLVQTYQSFVSEKH
jgi:GDP-L-fucose synthase